MPVFTELLIIFNEKSQITSVSDLLPSESSHTLRTSADLENHVPGITIFLEKLVLELTIENHFRRCEFISADSVRIWIYATAFFDGDRSVSASVFLRSTDSIERLASMTRIFLANSEDAVYMINTSGIILEMNDKAAFLLNSTRQILIGKCVFDFFSADVSESRRDKFIEVLETGKTVRFDDCDGERFSDHILSPVFSDNGNMRGILFQSRDITALKTALLRMKNAESQLASLFSCSVDGMAVLNSEGLIVQANKALCEMSGFDSSSILGIYAASRYVHSPDQLQMIPELLLNGTASCVKEFYKKDGTILPLEITGWKIDSANPDGKPLFGFHVKDLTQRRKMEERLSTARHLEQLSSFVAGIMHDFNNLLSGMNGYTEILMQDSTGFSSAQKRYLSEIEKLLERSKNLTDRFRSLSSRRTPGQHRTDIYALLMDVFRDSSLTNFSGFCHELGFRSSEFYLDVSPSDLYHLFRNLLENSLNAFSGISSPLISVTARSVRSKSTEGLEKEMVKIDFSDNGCGMSEEVRKQIFDPLFSCRKTGKGCGLGMTIVQCIVCSIYGGEISVQSDSGKGTTVTILLPESRKSSG